VGARPESERKRRRGTRWSAEGIEEGQEATGRPYPCVNGVGGGAHHCGRSNDGESSTELLCVSTKKTRKRRPAGPGWAAICCTVRQIREKTKGNGPETVQDREKKEKGFLSLFFYFDLKYFLLI
jgi:hypothetical protein